MRITCPKCNADFALPPSQMETSAEASACPFCGSEYRVEYPEEAADPKIVFGPKGSRPKRICIECSKEFESNDQDVIPICPTCKGIRHLKAEHKIDQAPWKLLKAGKIMEIPNDQMIMEWILEGAIVEEEAACEARQVGEADGAQKTGEQHRAVHQQSLEHT